jgi:hypothetical protein
LENREKTAGRSFSLPRRRVEQVVDVPTNTPEGGLATAYSKNTSRVFLSSIGP